jgi:hypothetical protein
MIIIIIMGDDGIVERNFNLYHELPIKPKTQVNFGCLLEGTGVGHLVDGHVLDFWKQILCTY